MFQDLYISFGTSCSCSRPARIFRSYIPFYYACAVPLAREHECLRMCVRVGVGVHDARVLTHVRLRRCVRTCTLRARARARDMRSCRNSPGDVNSPALSRSRPSFLPPFLSHPLSLIPSLLSSLTLFLSLSLFLSSLSLASSYARIYPSGGL